MNVDLDIIICTYEREELLADCLKALRVQDSVNMTWGIIIVNNAPKPFSEKTLNIIDQIGNAQTIHESKPGLSIARNKGISESSASWLAFLDDDAKVPDSYVSKIELIIKENDFDCFGGHIESWWRYGQPRWLNSSFGSKPKLRKDIGEIPQQYNWGSNIIIKRNALSSVGNFPISIGMKGSKLGYAAENIVQLALRQKGYKIGYDPDLHINHVVMKQKLRLLWHLKSAYATGRDGKQVFSDQYGLMGFLKSAKNCLSRPIKSLTFFLSDPNFYWENLVLESMKPYFLLIGKIHSLLIR